MCGAGTIAILGIGGFLVWKYALGSPTNVEEFKDGVSDAGDYARRKWDELDLGNFTDVLDGLDGISFGDLFQEDPSYGDGETTSWDRKYVKPGNGGLHLTLQNALDETWQRPFELAVADWNESPALTLTTQRVAVDHTCTPVSGVMVVCNANFGETGWVGINENSILGGYIVESVSKMNEFYLRNANAAHRRFTMCHEIGHGELSKKGSCIFFETSGSICGIDISPLALLTNDRKKGSGCLTRMRIPTTGISATVSTTRTTRRRTCTPERSISTRSRNCTSRGGSLGPRKMGLWSRQR